MEENACIFQIQMSRFCCQDSRIADELGAQSFQLSDVNPVSRRGALKLGVGAAAAITASGLIPPTEEEADAGLGLWLAGTIVGSAIGWFIDKMLDRWHYNSYRRSARLASYSLR
jgi:hypothetical protein